MKGKAFSVSNNYAIITQSGETRRRAMIRMERSKMTKKELILEQQKMIQMLPNMSEYEKYFFPSYWEMRKKEQAPMFRAPV